MEHGIGQRDYESITLMVLTRTKGRRSARRLIMPHHTSLGILETPSTAQARTT